MEQGRKKYYASDRMYSNTKKKNLNLRNVFYARKMAPSSQGSVSIYLIKIQLESQPSVLKIIYEEAAEGQTWGETM